MPIGRLMGGPRRGPGEVELGAVVKQLAPAGSWSARGSEPTLLTMSYLPGPTIRSDPEGAASVIETRRRALR